MVAIAKELMPPVRCYSTPLLTAGAAAVASLPMEQRRMIPADEPPRIPATAAILALADMRTLAEPVRAQRFYIWCPNGSLEENAIARLAVNIAVSHSPVDYNPSPIAGGALMPVDLLTLCPDAKDFDNAISVWHSLSDLEPYFHVQIVDPEFQELIDCEPWHDREGHLFTQKWAKRRKVVHVAAPHLGPAGIELERLMGNVNPGDQSFCPIVRLDWFLWASLSSIDGSKYLDFRNLKVFDPNDPKSKDKATRLAQYLLDRGIDERFIKRKNSDERAAMISKVTGRARGVNMEQGMGTRPTGGPAIVSITDDNFADRDQPQQDPFYSLLDHQPDAHEVILTQSNGWPEFTLFNGQGLLIAEAPPNVVSDHRIPEPFPKRLNGAISCIRCHGPTDNWQPFRNEVKDSFVDRVRTLNDFSGRSDSLANLTRIASLYTGDLGPVVQTARNYFDRRCFAVSGLPAKKLTQAVSDLYAAHEYVAVDAKTACAELGIEVQPKDTTGAITFRRVVPPKSLDGSIPDDPLIGRLHSDYLDAETNKRVGLTLTRRQWELIYGDAMDRALAHSKP